MDEKNSVVLIAGNEDSRQKLETLLNSAGFHTYTASNGADALTMIAKQRFDLVLLEASMPGLDGYQLTRKLRSGSDTQKLPIMMVSSNNEVDDQVRGLELGADDYLYKMIDPRLLLARIKNCLRRIAPPRDPDRVVIGKFRIDRSQRSVRMNSKDIDVTDAEFDLLWLLSSNAGKVFTREDIFRATRGLEYDGLDRSIDMRISRLRKLLGDDVTAPVKIQSVRGKGYLFSRRGWN